MKNNNTVSSTSEKAPQWKPWSGRVNEHERTRPGGLLMAALIECAAERGQTQNELSECLGRHYSYLTQLRTGHRSVCNVGDDFSQACAEYLGIPRVEVLIMAGQLGPADFFQPGDAYERALTRAMNFICDDHRYGHLITNELRNAGHDTQYAIVRLYESATGTVLLPQRSECAEVILGEALTAPAPARSH